MTRNEYEEILANVAEGGQNDIIKWMLFLGAKDYKHAMIRAAGDHMDSVQLILDCGDQDYNEAMRSVSR